MTGRGAQGAHALLRLVATATGSARSRHSPPPASFCGQSPLTTPPPPPTNCVPTQTQETLVTHANTALLVAFDAAAVGVFELRHSPWALVPAVRGRMLQQEKARVTALHVWQGRGLGYWHSVHSGGELGFLCRLWQQRGKLPIWYTHSRGMGCLCYTCSREGTRLLAPSVCQGRETNCPCEEGRGCPCGNQLTFVTS